MESSIVVAIITAVGAIIVAYLQLKGMHQQNKQKKPQTQKTKALPQPSPGDSSSEKPQPADIDLHLWDGLSDTIVIVYGAKYNHDMDKDGHLSLSLRDLTAAQVIHSFFMGKYPRKHFPNKNFVLMPGLANGWQMLLKENTDLIIIGGFVVNEEFYNHRSRYQQKLRLKMGRLCHLDERQVYHVGLMHNILHNQPHEVEELSSKFVTKDFALVTRKKVHVYGADRNVITIAGIKGHGTLGAANYLTRSGKKTDLQNFNFAKTPDLSLELILKIDVVDNLVDKTEIVEIIANGKTTRDNLEKEQHWTRCELNPATNPCKTCTLGEILPRNQTDISLITKELNAKGIIFDLDDTLIDTFTSLIAPLEFEAAREMLLKDGTVGPPGQLANTLLELRKKNPSRISELLAEEFSFNHDAIAKRQSLVENYENIEFGDLKIDPKVRSLLKELKIKYQLFLITEGDKDFQLRKIKHLGIEKLFTEIKITSPQQETKEKIIADLMKEHDLENNRLMVIGNRLDKEIMAGNKLNIRTVWIKQGEGSNPSSDDPLGIPDFIMDNILQVRKLLLP